MRTLQAIVSLRRTVLVRQAQALVGRVFFGALFGLVLAATQPVFRADTTPQYVPRGRGELVQYAESLLHPRLRRSTDGHHVLVVSDAQSGRADAAMAANFEAVYRVLQTILRAPSDSDTPDATKVRAYLFQSADQYKSFEKYADPRAAGRTSGMYFTGYGILAFHLEMYSQPWVRHVMLHECTHAFLDQRIRLTEHNIPIWLQEGLAEYIGLSLVSGGQIHVGVFTTKTRHESFEGTFIIPSEASEQLSRGRKALRRKLPLETLLTTEPASVEGQDRLQDYYAACWLLVSYLRDGRQEWSMNQFPALVREVGAGHSDRETLETVYGVTGEELEAGLHRYIKDLKLVRGSSAPDED